MSASGRINKGMSKNHDECSSSNHVGDIRNVHIILFGNSEGQRSLEHLCANCKVGKEGLDSSGSG